MICIVCIVISVVLGLTLIWGTQDNPAFSQGEKMHTLPLQFRERHLFLELDGDLWLLDTGAPASFGTPRGLTLAGEPFNFGANYLGLTAETLAQFVGMPCVGLLGADVLGRFDHLFDIAGGSLTVSTDELPHNGQTVRLDMFMGIPIVTARVSGRDYRMFFDTGAQISYFQDDSLAAYPPAGRVTDFYPGFGQFQADTYHVPAALGGVGFTLRCGALPRLLATALMQMNTEGIVGNAILRDRKVGYFPRRRLMAL